MSGPGSIVAATLLGLSIIVLGDLVSEEVRARLDRLPYAIIDRAARRLPDDFRADFLAERKAELTVILKGRKPVQITTKSRRCRSPGW
jgi:hypothetical protein